VQNYGKIEGLWLKAKRAKVDDKLAVILKKFQPLLKMYFGSPTKLSAFELDFIH